MFLMVNYIEKEFIVLMTYKDYRGTPVAKIGVMV